MEQYVGWQGPGHSTLSLRVIMALANGGKIAGILFCGWLGGFKSIPGESTPGRLLTIEQVGAIMKGAE